MDLTKYAKGKRMVREDLIKQIEKNKEEIAELILNQLTAGTGIVIEDNEVSVDEEVVALKDELPAEVEAITPTGTEAALEGLKIGDTSYKVGGAESYLHRFNYDDDQNQIHYAIFILNSSPDAINTFDKFYENINKIVQMIYVVGGEQACTSVYKGEIVLQSPRVLLYIYTAYNARNFLAIYKDDQTGLKITDFTETIVKL